MTITWQAVSIMATLGLAWSAFLFAGIRWLFERMIANMEGRIRDASDTAKAARSELQQHREEYLTFLGQLPIEYYRREDMIRFETLTHAKLDALANDIKQLECLKCQHHQ